MIGSVNSHMNIDSISSIAIIKVYLFLKGYDNTRNTTRDQASILEGVSDLNVMNLES